MRITYRIADAGDIEAMARFWSENSGWDVIDAAEWKRRFTNTPFGDAVVSVGTDEETGKIIGQFVFIPVRINVKGKELKAYRPFAPVLQESLQTKFGVASLLTGAHPILMLYKKVARYLLTQDAHLLYIIPDPRWSRIIQAFPFIKTHKFPLWSHQLPFDEFYTLPAEISSKRIEPSDSIVDELWAVAAVSYTSVIVRNSKMMTWKASHGDYRVFAIFKNNMVTGLFSIIYKRRDHQWLICDLVTKDAEENLTSALAVACNTVQQENNLLQAGEAQLNKVALLATPVMEKILHELGFKKENYNYTLAVQTLNIKEADKNLIAPANWHLSAND